MKATFGGARPTHLGGETSVTGALPLHMLIHRATQVAIKHNERIASFTGYALRRELYNLPIGERKFAIINNSLLFPQLRTIPDKFINTICNLDKSRLENILRCYEEAQALVTNGAFTRIELTPVAIIDTLSRINVFNGARLYFTGDKTGDSIHEDQLLVIHLCGGIFFTVPVCMDEAVFFDGSLIHTQQKINSVIRHAYVHGVQPSEPYFYDCSLPCLRVSSDVIRDSLPTCKSVSGRFAAETNECSQDSVMQFEDFSTLRNRRRPIMATLSQRKAEMQQMINFNRLNPSMVTVDMKNRFQALKSDVERLSIENKRILLLMIDNGVLNYGEYADLALLIVNSGHMLTEGYEAYIAQLHNSGVPPTSNNHDHAFLVIVDQTRKEHFVVDFWQSTTWPAYTTFVGTLTDFIQFLNDNPDGQYIKRELLPIKLNDIRIT